MEFCGAQKLKMPELKSAASILPESSYPPGQHSLGPRGIPWTKDSSQGGKGNQKVPSSLHHQGLQLTPADRAAWSPCHCMPPKQDLPLHPSRVRGATPFPPSPHSPKSWCHSMGTHVLDAGTDMTVHIPLSLILAPKMISLAVTYHTGEKESRRTPGPHHHCEHLQCNWT